jgi:hypothetical protein
MSDPYEGWEMRPPGCHWNRKLPDGRSVTMSSWSCGSRSGYVLVLDFERRVFGDLDAAKAAYEYLCSAPGLSIADAPGALDE